MSLQVMHQRTRVQKKQKELGKKRRKTDNQKSSVRKKKRASEESYSLRESNCDANKARIPLKKMGPFYSESCRKKQLTLTNEEKDKNCLNRIGLQVTWKKKTIYKQPNRIY